MSTKIPDCFKEIVERLRNMPTPEQIKRQQALDFIKATEPKAK